MAILLESIEFLFHQIQKLDEEIYTDTVDNLVPMKTSDEAAFNGRVVQVIAELRFQSRDQPSGEFCILAPQTSQLPTGAVATRTKLPTLELTKFDGDRRNWLKFWTQFETTIHTNPEL